MLFDMATKGSRHETTAMTAEDLQALASTIDYFARRYRDVASQMNEADIELVHVTGIKTLRNVAFRFLRGAIASATSALDAAVLERDKADPPEHSEEENSIVVEGQLKKEMTKRKGKKSEQKK